ncbi:OLC1v1007420C1 [Oldenlandia corymbosa var. corymbosa]|uniref:OLC1v1007420C1 n=1 Tax=Oldenlandia corymbosa var. corymbosa TaxID=529605 RepID=A0AAV1DJ84_OLDCO|nr:OLC1v1007420C1 [Oldenlandia corymbosa var. corymbosa]
MMIQVKKMEGVASNLQGVIRRKLIIKNKAGKDMKMHCFVQAGILIFMSNQGMGKNIRKVVDLKKYGANELLKKIRQHSSSYGDPTERLTHYFGDALEAWMTGMVAMSVTCNFPPKLKITGIDLPQPGFHSVERIEETRHRLANYVKRFNLPFGFHVIAKRCEAITKMI